jgi:riboflavin kinase
LETLHVKGKVFTGNGEGARYISLPWVTKQIEKKLHFTPFAGTLNLRLVESMIEIKKRLSKSKAIEIVPAEGFCRGLCFRAHLINDISCAVIIPGMLDYPDDVLEIIASVNLRQRLGLKDGDTVTTAVDI